MPSLGVFTLCCDFRPKEGNHVHTEIESFRLSRRGFLNAAALGAASIAVSACTTTGAARPVEPPPPQPMSNRRSADYATMYAAGQRWGFELPAIPIEKIDPQFLRQIVPDPTGRTPGHHRRRYDRPFPLSRARRRPGDPLWRRPRPRRLRMVGRRRRPVEAEMAEMDAAGRDDRPPAGTEASTAPTMAACPAA